LFELDPRPFEAEIGRATAQIAIYDAQESWQPTAMPIGIANCCRNALRVSRDVDKAEAKAASLGSENSSREE